MGRKRCLLTRNLLMRVVVRANRTRTGIGLTLLALLGLHLIAAAGAEFPDPLPGTTRLQLDQPLDVVMVDGINKFAERALAESVAQRAQFWHRDFSSPEAYEKSVAPNREHLRKILGVVDERVKP